MDLVTSFWGFSETLGIRGFEKVYSLFVVSGVCGTIFARSFIIERSGYFAGKLGNLWNV